MGTSVLNLDSTNGPFTIRLLNDASLTPFTPQTIILATGSTGSFQRNGSAWDAVLNPYGAGSDFNVVSNTGSWVYSPATLSVDALNNLVLSFTPVPEPISLVIFGALIAWRCRHRKSSPR